MVCSRNKTMTRGPGAERQRQALGQVGARGRREQTSQGSAFWTQRSETIGMPVVYFSSTQELTS